MPHIHKPLVSPSLIGRTHELEILEQVAADAMRGAGQCLFIAGEAGVGKSRLIAELRRRLAMRRFIVLQGHCSDQDFTLPYAPWIDLLRAFFAHLTVTEIEASLGPWLPEVIKVLPEL